MSTALRHGVSPLATAFLVSATLLLTGPARADTVFAITDVRVADDAAKQIPYVSVNGAAPVPTMTGVSKGKISDAYIPGTVGTFSTAGDVNEGVGGSGTGIYLAYAELNRTSPTPVVIDMVAAHWPNWKASCPAGYVVASGTSANIPGALTTGTKGKCNRTGLCVRYAPLNQTDFFVAGVGMSRDSKVAGTQPKDASTPNPSFATASTRKGSDIQRGCGGPYQYLWIKSWTTSPARPKDFNDVDKRSVMTRFAPQVYLAPEEKYFPSSVEFVLPHMSRKKMPDGTYWLVTNETLPTPSSTLSWFSGSTSLDDAPAYAFWRSKTQYGEPLADVAYFFFFPYNRGKEKLNTVWGNHVGDWEHVTIRLRWKYAASGWGVAPVQLYLSSHDGGSSPDWDAVPKALATHPIVYCAWGSHGFYSTPGSHIYKTLPVVGAISDETGQGTLWNTWDRVVAYDYDSGAAKPLDPGASSPLWMSDAKGGSPYPGIPDAEPIWRWGNPEQGCPAFAGMDAGICRLEDGPTGPGAKTGVWTSIDQPE